MPTGRKTDGYSPAYEKRLKAFFKKNPYGTLAEARGHKNKMPNTRDPLKLTEYVIKEKIKLQHVKKRLGLITEKEVAKNITEGRFYSIFRDKDSLFMLQRLPVIINGITIVVKIIHISKYFNRYLHFCYL